MREASKELDFERAITLREEIKELKNSEVTLKEEVKNLSNKYLDKAKTQKELLPIAIVTLILGNMVSGILMLVMKDEDLINN